jgi:hypothetical protein
VFQEIFRDSEKLWFFNSGTSSFPRRILLSTWSISKAVGPFDMTNIGGGSISWKGDLDLEEVLGISNTF